MHNTTAISKVDLRMAHPCLHRKSTSDSIILPLFFRAAVTSAFVVG